MKSMKFERILADKMKDELREFALGDQESSSEYLSLDSDKDPSGSSPHREKKIVSQKMSVWDKLNMSRQRKEDSRSGSPKSLQSPAISFFSVNKDYQIFLRQRKGKLQDLARLEKELTVTQEK